MTTPAFPPGVILSMEQALSLTSATLRFAQLGWRVIKLESTPHGGGLPGDPNRYIGARFGDSDRRSYFVAPNVGKESIALNLKTEAGRAALRRIIAALGVDIFCCNTLPARYAELGVDYETLAAVKPDLIWAAISAMGPDHPDAAGYDPAVQAMVGFMAMTGMRDGPPTLSGVPLVDLKAGDEVYANCWRALAERAVTGRGARIDVSMLQAAASWLITTLPLVDFGCDESELSRAGNEHRKYVPTNAYPTRDGAVLMAIGSDAMWRRFVGLPAFATVATPERAENRGRVADRDRLNAEIAAAFAPLATAEAMAMLRTARIPVAPILTVREAMDHPAIAPKLTRTTRPDGAAVRMQPPAVDAAGARASLAFPPRYGEQTASVLREAGYDAAEIRALADAGVTAGPETFGPDHRSAGDG